MSAQDNKREILQMIRFGFDPEHKRDEDYDASYKSVRYDFKTRNVGLNSKVKPAPQTVTTKRRYDLDSFEDIVLMLNLLVSLLILTCLTCGSNSSSLAAFFFFFYFSFFFHDRARPTDRPTP